jgi:NAD(P)-dependent dehydrogenase (short-subunit alcohol dehydrogenase family)
MKTSVVTGSQSGMGLAIRKRLESKGWRIIGVDLPGKGAEVEGDLSTPAGRENAAAAIIAGSGGRLEAVVANAGVDVPRPELVVGLNYHGVVDLLGRLRPSLAAAGGSRVVVNVSNSIFITPGIPMEPVEALLRGATEEALRLLQGAPQLSYVVSKLATAWWIRRMAPTAEWAGSGISVNGVCPGAVKTPLLEHDLADPVKGPIIRGLPRPLGEFTPPEAVAQLFEFLVGEGGRFLVGQLLVIDGGNEAAWRGEDQPRPWGISGADFMKLIGKGAGK